MNVTAEEQAQPSPLRETLACMFYRFEVIAMSAWFVARWLVHGAYLHVPIELPYVDAITVVLATVATIFGLSRWWPNQNVIAVSFLTVALSGVLEHILIISTGSPYSDNAGAAFFGVPWTLPLIWFIAMLNARSVARLVLWPKREKGSYGLWLILFTSVMTALALLVNEAVCGRFYNWGALVALCAVRFLAAVFFLAIVAPFLIPKGGVIPAPDCGPVAIWAVLNAYLIIVAAIVHSWESAGILVVLNGMLTTVGLRWRKKRKPKAATQQI
ncbi:MAG: carotenoid biosynthesis protein [Limisphaerales bacterium]